jgi:hypothetical protein
VIIEPKEVPDEALDALMGWVGANLTREGWRGALADALTEWEKRPRDLVPLIAGHDCGWQILAVQNRDAILGIKQTDVLQRCAGCGDVRTQVLTGTWTLEQLNA